MSIDGKHRSIQSPPRRQGVAGVLLGGWWTYGFCADGAAARPALTALSGSKSRMKREHLNWRLLKAAAQKRGCLSQMIGEEFMNQMT